VGEGAADVAVVGLGAMGSMALWRLAARGARVIGYDRFSPPHDRGATHGESRMLRSAYHEGAFYVPLVGEAIDLWRQLELETRAELLTLTGAQLLGPPDGELVAGALASAREHRLEHRLLDEPELRRRQPGLRLGPDDVALWEARAGLLRPEACVAAALARAGELGAEVHRNTTVVGVSPDGEGVVVHSRPSAQPAAALRATGEAASRVTARHARRAVVSVGPWLPQFPGLGTPPLWVERQVMGWFAVDDPATFAPERFCVWAHQGTSGPLTYGFPTLDGATVKAGVHHGGQATTADTVDRTVGEADLAALRALAMTRLRGVRPEPVRARVCLYTNTTDEHFLVGPAPGCDGAILLGGFSGHGFKFASVIGDIAADLALTGSTLRQIAAFATNRSDVAVRGEFR